MKNNLLIAFTASLILVVVAQAQKPSGGGQSQGTSSSSSGNANGNVNGSTNRQPDMDSLIRQGQAGSYYGGTVKVSEGALPWDPIVVNVVCKGETKFTTVTDPKGNFLIAPRQGDAAANAAASTPNGPGGDQQNKFAAQYVGCNVQAALPGYDST
jgi:hypothetical protein